MRATQAGKASAWMSRSAARVTRLFNGGGRYAAWLKRAAGTVFLGLGIRLAMADRI